MEYDYRDILKIPLNVEELGNLAALANLEIRDLVNQKRDGFREMDVDPETMTSELAGKLILENPRIMHRPLLTDGIDIVVGFEPEEMEKII
ncbi:MAG: ArsC/Spx/MgsR family protein [Bacillota bacterium]